MNTLKPDAPAATTDLVAPSSPTEMSPPTEKRPYRKGGEKGAVDGDGGPFLRQSSRHWLRRNLELPKSMISPVPMCPADDLTRKVVSTLEKLEGKDFIQCLVAIHGDAYGQEHRVEVTPVPSHEEAALRAAQLLIEERRLLAGGK